ncbi:hypothetical protein NQZ68_039997 [Dissostichus eleginoides]|nr:hypothetical protein NQZ68_039997 [Dissostichus eleginoides]
MQCDGSAVNLTARSYWDGKAATALECSEPLRRRRENVTGAALSFSSVLQRGADCSTVWGGEEEGEEEEEGEGPSVSPFHKPL